MRGVPCEASEQLRGRVSAQLLRDLDAMDAATPDDGANMEKDCIKGAGKSAASVLERADAPHAKREPLACAYAGLLAARGWTPTQVAHAMGEEPSSLLAAQVAHAMGEEPSSLLAAQGWTPQGAEFPAEFTDDGEPSSLLAARSALAWSVSHAPDLVRGNARAIEGDAYTTTGEDLDAREKLSGALADRAARELRAAGDDAATAVRLAAAGDKGAGGEFAAGEFARRVECAERAFYFARWLAAAVAWERAEGDARGEAAADLPQAPGALRGTAEGTAEGTA